MQTLQTQRLVLEPQEAAHAEAMFPVLSDPAIYEFENTPPASLAALRERYRKLESRRSPDGRQRWLNWVARMRSDDAAIGYVQATVFEDGHALVAYEFGSRWWGRGLASEAVAACIDELRTAYRVRLVGAVFKRDNERSRRLLVRLGMQAAAPGRFPSPMRDEDEDAFVMPLPND